MRTPQTHVIFVGPDKTGSTWIYDRARELPRVSTTRAKDLFFFDRFHGRGLDWYLDQFDVDPHAHARLEVGHDYVFSREALGRIASGLPDARVVLGLREPVQRAVSAYRFLRSQGRTALPIDRAVLEIPELVDHGRYGQLLTSMRGFFDPSAIQFFVFDDLVDDPATALANVARWCDVPTPVLPRGAETKANAARTARNPGAVRIARSAGHLARTLRLGSMTQAAKDSTIVQRLFFEPDRDPPPRLSSSVDAALREIFTPEVHALEALSGLRLAQRWGYPVAPPRAESAAVVPSRPGSRRQKQPPASRSLARGRS